MDITKATEPVSISCDALTALAILGGLHLALKHPANTGPTADLMRRAYLGLCDKVAATGLLTAEELADAYNMRDVELSRHQAQRMLARELQTDAELKKKD